MAPRATPTPTALARAFACLAVACAFAEPGLAGGVRILDRPALESFGTIQAAVDAAIDGETLLVAAGTYTGFNVVNKTVAIVAAPSAVVDVGGTIEIDDLGPLRWVALVGITATGVGKVAPQVPDPAVRLVSNLGHVHFDNCTLRGASSTGLSGFYTYAPGGTAVLAIDSRKVSFVRCNLLGSDGAGNNSGNYETTGGTGGRGLDAQQSTVALYDSSITGGKGGPGGSYGGRGGDAYHQVGYGVVAVNTTLTGGRGGNAWDYLFNQSGDGGDAVYVDAGAQAQLLDDVLAGGAAGTSWGDIGPGTAGSAIAGSGIAVQHSGSARTATVTAITDDQSLWNVQVTGEPGDHITLASSSTPAFALPSPVNGIQLVPASSTLLHAPVKVPASGSVSFNVRIARIDGADPARFLFLQAWFDDSAGVRWLGSPMHRLALDRRGQPDCNGNNRIDLLDIALGAAPDADRDLVIDACDHDCNGNGVIDGLDIAGGASTDLNHDLVPDSCEPPRTWYVDDNAPQGGDGSSASPFRSLRAAIDLALAGDTVIARDGTYSGADNRGLDFRGRNVVVKSLNGPAACTIDCLGAGRAFYLHSLETLASTIEGFTIRNGLAYEPSVTASNAANQGGGILALDAAPTVRNCVVQGCSAYYFGGGLSMKGGRVENCTITGNSARHPVQSYGSGGGLYCDGSVIVVGCRIEGNDARSGGGLVVGATVAPGVAIVRCKIAGNSADLFGGGVLDNSGGNSLVLVDQCSIVGNTATKGGGVYSNSYVANPPSSIEIHNSTFAGNSTSDTGSALVVNFRKHGSLSNSIIWGNTASLGHSIRIESATGTLAIDSCDVQGGAAGVDPGAGSLAYASTNIALDPMFADLAYHVAPFSPCIDAGDNSAIALDRGDSDGDGNINEPAPLDLDHNARRVDDPNVADTGLGSAPIVDLGAYERVP